MNKFKMLLLGILLGTLFIACGKEDSKKEVIKKEVIRVGTSGGYYPFTYTENDELKGFDIDIWNELGKRLGKEVEFKQAKFSGLFGMLDIGKIDTISNQITITEKRSEKYNFSIPYVYSGAQFFVAKGNPKGITGIEDLAGRRVATEVGTNYEEIVRELSTKIDFETVVYNSGSLVKDVELGRVDTFMMDKVSIIELIKKNDLQIELLDKPAKYIANAFPFVKNEKSENIMKEVNGILNEMRKDGTLLEISNKYFGMDITSN